MRDNASFVMAAVVLVFAAVLWFSGPRGGHALIGQESPELTLQTLNGGELELASLEGEHVVLLDFWATWCGPCRSSMPMVERVVREFKDDGVVLYAVNQNEDPALVQSFIERMGLDVTVALDPGYQAGRAFAVQVIPQLVVIDRAGKIHDIHVGAGAGLERELRRQLDELTRSAPL